MKSKQDNFSQARTAIGNDDHLGFSQALEAEKRINPLATRDMAEVMILRMFHKVNPQNSAAIQMLSKSIDILTELTPLMLFNEEQRHQTLRALTVAEAASEWADDISARKIVEAQHLALHTSKAVARDNAQRAGLLSSTGRVRSRLKAAPAY